MKIYLLYLKATNELYGWTTSKKIFNDFLNQRDKKSFYTVSKSICDDNEHDVRKFMNDESGLKISSDYLFDGKNTIEVLATAYESTSLSESCEALSRDIDAILNNALDGTYNILTEKEIKVICELCDIYKLNTKTKSVELNLNTFKMFMHMFGCTFDHNKTTNNDDIYYRFS